MNALEHHVSASAIARKLRGFNDGDLAWLAWLSPSNMALVCERFETTEDVLRLAQVYETARRLAFPERQTNIPIAPHAAADSALDYRQARQPSALPFEIGSGR